MASIKDDRGYNQGFAPSKSTSVRMSRRANWLLSEMTLTKDSRVLEIGCGTGEVSNWIAERSPAQVVGSDLCVPFIEQARKTFTHPNLSFAVVDFNEPVHLENEKFDYIVGNGILHHLYHHLDKDLASMRGLLKENGKIIFLEPNIFNPYVYAIFSHPKLRTRANLEPDEMAFSPSFITNALARNGFTNIKVDFKDFLLPGIPSFLIAPSILVGAVVERIPLLNRLAQSLFIRAERT